MDTAISPFKFQRMSWMLTLRDLLVPPEEIMDEVDIQPGFKVLDYGCGTGSFTFEAAKRAGPEGRVYALDIHPLALEKVQKGALRKGLVNISLDRAVFRPVAKGYDAVMPDGPQRSVRNFFRNLGYPVTLLNSLLQGNMERAFTSTGRFMMNTTIGLLGFFDVATKAGIPFYEEDFGQTLATWGWMDSRYLVMPVLGPFTVRDLLGRSFYGYAHPVSWAIREHDQYLPLIVDLVSLRAELLPLQAELDAAADPYVLIRDVFLQRRQYEIFNGDPPAPDYDALLEEY